MVIDTSAIIAFLLNEPDAPRVQTAFSQHKRRVMSAVNFLEVQLVCAGGRFGPEAALGLERLIRTLEPVHKFTARLSGGVGRCSESSCTLCTLRFLRAGLPP